MPSSLSCSIAGSIIFNSSLPKSPLSPACGFSPKTAIFGFLIAKSLFRLSL